LKKVRIATGAGYSGDRIEPAIEVAVKGRINYIIFECLAERTIALAQRQKLLNNEKGFDNLLEARMNAIIPICKQKNIKIITNMGAANPEAAGDKISEIVKALGLEKIKIAVILGDDVSEILWKDPMIKETILDKMDIEKVMNKIISANAYTGVSSIIEALRKGSDIIITGRTADTSLFLAPMIYELGWREDDWNLIGAGIVVAHLMECGGQVTGGYFADPGKKNVQDLARLGFPIAEVYEDGKALITKVPEAGGAVTLQTCKEQLLYEIHDPSAYITPDGIADFTDVTLEDIGKDLVKVTGGKGKPRPENLKVNIGYLDGYIGEGQISYSGPGAFERAKLAAQIVHERFKIIGLNAYEIRTDFIGVNSLYSPLKDEPFTSLNEIRLRIVGRTKNEEEAKKIGDEVESLYTNGPAGGGGVTKMFKDVLAITSSFIPRERVRTKVYLREFEK